MKYQYRFRAKWNPQPNPEWFDEGTGPCDKAIPFATVNSVALEWRVKPEGVADILYLNNFGPNIYEASMAALQQRMHDAKAGKTTPRYDGALPTDSAERKTYPLCSGLLDYFPAALAAVAHHSYVGNEKHNPGQPMHWSREKSSDHLDCAVRHIMERDLEGAAWRILAALQVQLESKGAPLAPAAHAPATIHTLSEDAE